MKQILTVIVIFFIGSSRAQYGIPDDDDAMPQQLRPSSPMLFSSHRMGKTMQFPQHGMDNIDSMMTQASEQRETIMRYPTTLNTPSILKITATEDETKDSNIIKIIASTPSFQGKSSIEFKAPIIQTDSTKSRSIDLNAPIALVGSFSYLDDEGETYTMDWKADDKGFQAKGGHLS